MKAFSEHSVALFVCVLLHSVRCLHCVVSKFHRSLY